MTIKIREWIQREWTNPGVQLYRERGDFGNLYGLMPEVGGRKIKRSPTWYGPLAPPDNFGRILAALYDQSTDYFFTIGQLDDDDHLASCYIDDYLMVHGPDELVAAELTLGGRRGQNAQWWGGYLWLIASDGNVYRGASYSAVLASFYASGDAKIIIPAADRMYLITTAGNILRLNDAGNAFVAYFTSTTPLDVTYVTPFRGYLTIFTIGLDGTLFIHSLPTNNATNLHQIASVQAHTGQYAPTGLTFAIHNDKIYFAAGHYSMLITGVKTYDFYTFNGSQIERIARIENIVGDPDDPDDPFAIGLIPWRGELVLYILASTGYQEFKMLVGDHFIDFAPMTAQVPVIGNAYGLGSELCVDTIITNIWTVGTSIVGELDTIETAATGFLFLYGATNGHLTTSYLDMGSPSKQKILHSITALTDTAAENFNVVIEYRTDEDDSWILAGTFINTRRAIASNIEARFYTVQARITLQDFTGQELDVRLEAISVLYAIDE